MNDESVAEKLWMKRKGDKTHLNYARRQFELFLVRVYDTSYFQ